jgi:DNA-binding transcriptional ArsR family regulator
MKRSETRVLKDPEKIKIVVDETRRNILSLLRFNDLTVSQMADVLQKDQSTIYRHMSKLEEAGFVEVRGEKKTHHIPEKVYARTAHFFILVPETEETSRLLETYSAKRMEKLYHLMKKMGADIHIDDDLITEGRRFVAALRSELFEEYEEIDEPLDIIMLKKLELFLILLRMEENETFRERVFQFIRKMKGSN